jgi:hypothetical protein
MRPLACLSFFVLLGLLAPPARAQDAKSFENAFYPLKIGNKWTYKAGNAQQQQVTVEVTKMEAIKRLIKEKGALKTKIENVAIYVLQITSGDKIMLEKVGLLPDGTYRIPGAPKDIELSGGVYRFEAAGKEIHPPECFLRLPLIKGAAWEVDSESAGVKIKGSFVGSDATVTVPAGKFQTMAVTSKELQVGTQPMALEYWFAPQVGIVKQRIQVGSNFHTTLELQKFEPAR